MTALRYREMWFRRVASQSSVRLLVVMLLVGAAQAAPRGGPLTVPDDATEPEEVVVIESPPEPGVLLQYEYMQHVYDARAKGSCLYKRGRYEEAFPYLLAAAKRGFKVPQARVGFLHQVGIGTQRDPYAAVGWLAVAAQGRTHPEIRNYFKDVWRRIPAQHMPRFEEIASEYRSKYGSRRHRVACDLGGAHLKTHLVCWFVDEGIFVDWQPLIDLLAGRPDARIDPFGTNNPLRPNRAGC